MPYRFIRSLSGVIALAAAASLFPAQAFAGSHDDVVASLRVLAGSQTLDEGTEYVTGTESLRGDPGARCFAGGAGGSGQMVKMKGPTALGIVKSALRWTGALSPISVTDEFGFGLGVCGIGGKKGNENRYWALTVNHQDPAMAGDQVPVDTGDEVLWYLTSFPPPPELEISEYPVATTPGSFQVTVVSHSCDTDFPPNCVTAPAEGATVTGGNTPYPVTDASGHATVTVAGEVPHFLRATAPEHIPSATERICVKGDVADCPPSPVVNVFGREVDDDFAATLDSERIKTIGGDDRIDLRQGGWDHVSCGTGQDKVILDAADHDDVILDNCERIIRR